MGSASGTGIIATAVTPVGTGCQHAAGSSGSCSCCSPCSRQGTCHQKPHVPTTSTLLAGRGRSSERQRPFKGLLLPFPPSKVQMGVKGLKRTQPPCGWDVFSKDGPISVPGQGVGQVPLLTVSGWTMKSHIKRQAGPPLPALISAPSFHLFLSFCSSCFFYS